MGCSVLSVVSSIAAAGLMGGGGLVPGLDGFDLTGSLGELGINTDLLGGVDLGGFNIDSLGELGINTDLIGNLSEFNISSMGDVLGGLNETIGSVVNDAINVAGDAVKSAIGDLPGGLTGQIDLGIFSDFALEGLDFPSSNLFESLGSQASGFLQNGIPSLTETISAAKGFVEQSAAALASIQNAANFQIGGQSFNALSIFDQVTGGAASRALQPINDIAGAVSSGVAVAGGLLQTTQNTIDSLQKGFTSFTSDVSQWGNMYNVSNLDKAFEPNEFAQHLVDQNIPEFNSYLYQEGSFPPTSIGQADPSSVLKVLQSVPTEIVETITKAVGFTKNITNLGDALIPAAVLSAGALTLVSNFKDVSDRLSTVGPTNLTTIGDLGKELNKIEFPTSSVLLGVERSSTTLSDTLNQNIAERQKLTGTGSGVFGNPTMNDMMGSFTGTYYTPRLIGMLSAQKRLIDSPEGQALKNAITNAVNNAQANLNTDVADAAAIRAAAQALLAKTESQTVEDLALLERFHRDIVNQLATEKRNLKAAQIDTGNIAGSLSSVMGFVSSLDVAYNDDFKLGYADWVKGAAAQDIYGDAIRYAIIEGKNRNILNSIGVNTNTVSVFDYTNQYAQEQAAILAKCCPPNSMSIEYPARGALLSTYCENGNFYGIYADGNGMSYFQLIQSNSPQCI